MKKNLIPLIVVLVSATKETEKDKLLKKFKKQTKDYDPSWNFIKKTVELFLEKYEASEKKYEMTLPKKVCDEYLHDAYTSIPFLAANLRTLLDRKKDPDVSFNGTILKIELKK